MSDTEQLLRRFVKLPKRYAGQELTVTLITKGEFKPLKAGKDSWWEVWAPKFEIPLGESLECTVDVGDVSWLRLLAIGDIAEQVVDLPKGTAMTAKVKTLFLVFNIVTAAGVILGLPEAGLLLLEVLDVQQPK